MDLWTLDLAVEADEARRRLTPRVRVAGGTPFARGRLKVTRVDEDGARRGSAHRPLAPHDIGREVVLDPFPVPPGAAVGAALGWAWDVTVATGGRTRIQWRRYLEVDTDVTPDAELRLAGPSEPLRSKAEEEGWGPEAPWDPRDTDRLLASLVATGSITEADRKAVLAEADLSGRTAERSLVDLGLVSDREMLEAYVRVTGSDLVHLPTYPIDRDAAFRVPEEVARRYGLVPVGYRAGLLEVAMSDPQNRQALWEVESIRQPYIVVAPRHEVLWVLDRLRPR